MDSSPAGPVERLLALESRHQDLDFAEIRRRVVGKQPDAWRQFVERYSRTVYSIALSLAGNADREDWAQEIYLAVFRRLADDDHRLLREFRGDARFETYLFSAVRNEVSGLRRRTSRERARVQPLQHDGEETVRPSRGDRDAGADFAGSIGLDSSRVSELVSESLDRLPSQDRQVLQLRFRSGLSLRELATRFDWKDTNAAAYEIRKILGKLDLLDRCRKKLRWGEPERAVIVRHLQDWLEADAPPIMEDPQ